MIGVGDFAYKKRHTYGTIIVDGKTHEPVILLDGRNGDTLREWLKHNKNIKVVTRDRASAYAKVIAEELPDAMQVADRFHLHQNLLEAIKKALNHELCFLQALFPQKCRVTSSKLHGEFPQYCISPSGTLLGAGEEPLQAYKVY